MSIKLKTMPSLEVRLIVVLEAFRSRIDALIKVAKGGKVTEDDIFWFLHSTWTFREAINAFIDSVKTERR